MKISKEKIAGLVPVTEEELYYMAAKHKDYDLTRLDTSKIISMKGLFLDVPDFNQNIGNWDTSSLKNTENMFFNEKE